MEAVKPRGNIFLTVAVIVNILFSLAAIGCLIYKVRVLEEQVYELQSDSSKTLYTRSGENEDVTYRSKRSVESFGKSKSCTTCHSACVELFGLGASAKVTTKINGTDQDVVCMRGARGLQGTEGRRGRRGRPGYIGKAGKRGPPGERGPQGPRGRPGKAFAGNTSKLIEGIGIPRIKKGPPSSFTAKEGSNVSLPCYAKGYPIPEVTWYRNGQKLDSRSYDAVTGVLTFPSIQFGDRGLYKCEARNFLGIDSATVKIVVEVPPRFVEAPETYHMGYETWETTLSCNIFAFPSPKIEWTRSFRPLPIGRHVVAGKDLVIKDTRREDKGPFMCRGENHLGHVYALIVLVVNPVLPPVITVAPSSVVTVTKVHDSVTLQCAARGSPVPSLEWSKDGVVVSTNTTSTSADEVKGELVIPSFGPSDQGVYKCFFKNYENGTAEIATTAELVGCGDPGVPVHGYKIGENYWAGEMVTFACDTGYQLEGPTTRLCLENGNWSNVVPTCHLLCNEPAPLENGYRIGSEFWEGKNVTYKCNKGYRLRGPFVRVCNEIGNWTEEEPTCEGPEFEPSEILLNKTEYWELLKGWLDPVSTLPSKWKLCYRATDHGWSASTFHSQCNSLGPSVTFIRVGEYIFGGYTDRDWHSGSSYTDSTYSFIFSFKNHYGLEPFKLHVKKYSNAIYGNSGYGPTFGAGHDIYIANSAGSNTNSYSNLGSTYVQLAGYRYGSSEAQSVFAGSYKFQPHEVEVFYQTHMN
ncbi:hypothetical protein ACROYT_G030534 [Oculina patagonica]